MPTDPTPGARSAVRSRAAGIERARDLVCTAAAFTLVMALVFGMVPNGGSSAPDTGSKRIAQAGPAVAPADRTLLVSAH